MANTLTIQDTDFGTDIQIGDKYINACNVNVLKVKLDCSPALVDAYIEIEITPILTAYTFRMINLDFNGTTGYFYFVFTEILPAFFADVSDEGIIGAYDFSDTKVNAGSFDINVYDGTNPTPIIDDTYGLRLLFASTQIGENPIDWYNWKHPIFIAQKNKESYIYHQNNGNASLDDVITFEKIDRLPIEQTLIDFEVPLMDDGELLINTI